MSSDRDILKRFELEPGDRNVLFGGELARAAYQIDNLYRFCNFDHRPYLHPKEDELDAKMTEEYRLGHICFKAAVARILRPQTIVEIGVGSGSSALAFLDGCPSANYIGIDNGEWGTRLGYDFLQHAEDLLSRKRADFQIVRKSSQEMDRFPKANLIHIDGDHSMEVVRSDFAKAWRSESHWILCDDARDAAVVCGIFQALKEDLNRGTVAWTYFHDTWSGNILIHTDRTDP